MKINILNTLYIIICICFFSGCASMYVRGSNPVQRAVSSANLILDGNISDDYIKVYKSENAKAEVYINDMIAKAERNNIYYADIADNISDWILLYNKNLTLKTIYPAGLTGKKETVIFEPVDYTALKEKAFTKAPEALYEQALFLSNNSGDETRKAVKALSYLRRAKKYSHHIDDKINLLGAEISYNTAEILATSYKPDKLVKASEYYTQANAWVPEYKDSLQKAQTIKRKAAALYIEEGNSGIRLRDYTAFRYAKRAYLNAEKIIPGIAVNELYNVNRLLNIRLTIFLPEYNYYYSEEEIIRRAIQEKITYSSYGPDSIQVNFAHFSGRFGFIDTAASDLVLIPAENFGTVREIYGPVNTSYINVSREIDGIVYKGIITEQSQSVMVFFQNDFILYDVRPWIKKELKYFRNESEKISKVFTIRHYSGDIKAKPDNFDSGYLYRKGQYKRFFPELRNQSDSGILLQNYGCLGDMGRELCRVISNLQYEERR